ADLARDLTNLADALAGVEVAEAFLTAASPGVIALFLENRYYPTHEAYLSALAEAMKEEYDAIVGAGLLLQLDCPDPGVSRVRWIPPRISSSTPNWSPSASNATPRSWDVSASSSEPTAALPPSLAHSRLTRTSPGPSWQPWSRERRSPRVDFGRPRDDAGNT